MATRTTRRQCLQATIALGWPRVAWPGPAGAPPLGLLHDAGRRLSLLAEAGPSTDVPLPLAAQRWLAPGLLTAADGSLLRLAAPDARVSARRTGDGAPPRAALSSDGRWTALLPAAGGELLLLDEALHTVRRWPLPGPVDWIADAPTRRAFVLALAAPPQLWLLSYDERAEDFHEGLVHDFRLGEGVPQRAYLNPRRIPLAQPLLAASADAEDTEWAGRGQVFNLDLRRVVARPAGLEPPAAGAGARFLHRGVPALALPRAGRSGLLCLRSGDWATLGEPATAGEAARVLAWPAAGELLALPVPGAGPGHRIERIAMDRLEPLPPMPLPAPAQGAALLPHGRALAVALPQGLQLWEPGALRPRAEWVRPGVPEPAPLGPAWAWS